MARKTQSSNPRDVRAEVTRKIISALESGVAPWRKEWRAKSGTFSLDLPHNPFTGRNYHGINILLLWLAGEAFGCQTWGTYQQIQNAGGQVRKGEKGALVVLFKPWRITERDPDSGETHQRNIPIMRHFHVFNVAQADGLDGNIPGQRGALLEPAQRIANADEFLSNARADVAHSHSDRACYVPGADQIRMPFPQQFSTPEAYYATLLHEHCHWTGHHSRLDRKLSTRFGSESYAAEELIAELGAAFVCAELGIQSDIENHASYLDSWLRVLKADKAAIFTASAQAERAAEFLRSKQPWYVRTEPERDTDAQAA